MAIDLGMGGYGQYIWPVYGLMIIIYGAMCIDAVVKYQRIRAGCSTDE